MSDGSWMKSCPMEVRLIKLFHGVSDQYPSRDWIDENIVIVHLEVGFF